MYFKLTLDSTQKESQCEFRKRAEVQIMKIMSFVDIEEAFHKVSRKKLLSILEDRQIGSKTTRKARKCTNNKNSVISQ